MSFNYNKLITLRECNSYGIQVNNLLSYDVTTTTGANQCVKYSDILGNYNSNKDAIKLTLIQEGPEFDHSAGIDGAFYIYEPLYERKYYFGTLDLYQYKNIPTYYYNNMIIKSFTSDIINNFTSMCSLHVSFTISTMYANEASTIYFTNMFNGANVPTIQTQYVDYDDMKQSYDNKKAIDLCLLPNLTTMKNKYLGCTISYQDF